MNWYLTPDDGSNDGRHITYLEKGSMERYDPQLFVTLKQMVYAGKRNVLVFESLDMNLDIAMINKYYDLATMQPEIPATVRSHYMLLEHKAAECIGCHACESRCPFEVSIAEKMESTAKLFGC